MTQATHIKPATIPVASRGVEPNSQTGKNTGPSAPSKSALPAHVIAISSGKGGVGKTNISTNLAIAIAQKGSKVCIFDGDTSLANVNILLNISPKYTLEHLLNGSCTLNQVLTQGPGGISIIPAASGIAEFSNLNPPQQQILLQALAKLEQQFDYLIIDTAAGIGDSVLGFLMAVEHAIIIVTPEPTSLTDAFALIKVLRKQGYKNKLHILTNMVDDYLNSVDLFKRLSGTCNKYLKVKLNYFGYVPRDDLLRQSVRKRSPVMLSFPNSRASHRFHTLAESLKELHKGKAVENSMGSTFSNYLKNLFFSKTREDRNKQLYKGGDAGTNNVPTGQSKTLSKPSRARIIKLQQSMAQLIKGRSLSSKNMSAFITSLLIQVNKHYPEIELDNCTLGKPAKAVNNSSGKITNQGLEELTKAPSRNDLI